tara:strand:- start:1012 stop:1806 length:795 start_codon:yes stop_codon:yes gene_type:complete
MSISRAQSDFFSPMTGNVFRDRRRDNLIINPIQTNLVKTEDPRTITDAFDKEYGVLSDEEASTILQENQDKLDQPTPVINPEPTPEPEEPGALEEIIPALLDAAEEKKEIFDKKKGRRSNYKDPRRVANREKAKRMAKKRLAKKKKTASTSGSTAGGGMSRSRTGRGGRRGGSTGGRGASSKGGVSRGSRSGSPSRGGARGGSTGGRGASSRGGVSRGGARTNRSRSRRRCDIRCKFDISVLNNMNLIRDDLSKIAYFVQEIKK